MRWVSFKIPVERKWCDVITDFKEIYVSFLKYNIDLLSDDVSITKFNIILNMCMNDEKTAIGKLVKFRKEKIEMPKGKTDSETKRKITDARYAQRQARTLWQRLTETEANLEKFKMLGG